MIRNGLLVEDLDPHKNNSNINQSSNNQKNAKPISSNKNVSANHRISTNVSCSSKHSKSSNMNKGQGANSSQNAIASMNFSVKCGNKVCPVVITRKNHVYQASLGNFKMKTINVCQQCYQAWKNGQYCYYCGVIYREYKGTKGFNQHKAWIGCDFCTNWEHVQCEETKGNFYRNLSQLIKKDKHFKYKCPVCRKKSAKINGSRRCSFTKDESNERSSLQSKRRRDEESSNYDYNDNAINKRIIKKKKIYEGNNDHNSNNNNRINSNRNKSNNDNDNLKNRRNSNVNSNSNNEIINSDISSDIKQMMEMK